MVFLLLLLKSAALGDLEVLLDPLPLRIDSHVFQISQQVVVFQVQVFLFQLDGPRPLVGKRIKALQQRGALLVFLNVECLHQLPELVD